MKYFLYLENSEESGIFTLMILNVFEVSVSFFLDLFDFERKMATDRARCHSIVTSFETPV